MTTISTNRVQLVGKLGFDPEVRELAPGRNVARFSLMTEDIYMGKDGLVTDTQFHTIIAWGKVAKQVENLLRKGTHVSIEGRLVHRCYTGKEGTKRYITEVVLGSFTFVPQPHQDEEAMPDSPPDPEDHL